MEKQVESRSINFEMWNIMQYLSWILYSVAIITFMLIHQNVLEGKALVTVPLSDNPITFGFPTFIFMSGIYIHIWSIYIEKNVKQNLNNNTFLPALGLSISITFVAFLVTVIITLIEG